MISYTSRHKKARVATTQVSEESVTLPAHTNRSVRSGQVEREEDIKTGIELTYGTCTEPKYLGQTLSIRKAAKAVGISYTTLRARRNEGVTSRVCAQINMGNSIFTEAEERLVEKAIIGLTDAGGTVTKSIVKLMLQNFISDTGRFPPGDKRRDGFGKHFVDKFLGRHPKLEVGYRQQIDHNRFDSCNKANFDNYFRQYVATVEKYNVLVEDIWNVDEIGFNQGTTIRSKVVKRSSYGMTVDDVSRISPVKKFDAGKNKTAIECISAEGRIIAPYLIMNGTTFSPKSIPENAGFDWKFSAQENDFSTEQHGIDWLENHFDPLTKRYTKGKYRMLIVDGHTSHVSCRFMLSALERGIIVFLMPTHTSHALQPLDVSFFEPMKQYYAEEFLKASNDEINSHERMKPREKHLKVYVAARARVLEHDNGPHITQAGFRGAGLAPFNPERTYRHLNGISASDCELVFDRNLLLELDKRKKQLPEIGLLTSENSFTETSQIRGAGNSLSSPIEILEEESITSFENLLPPNGEETFEVPQTPPALPTGIPCEARSSPTLEDFEMYDNAFKEIVDNVDVISTSARRSLQNLRATYFFSASSLALKQKTLSNQLEKLSGQLEKANSQIAGKAKKSMHDVPERHINTATNLERLFKEDEQKRHLLPDNLHDLEFVAVTDSTLTNATYAPSIDPTGLIAKEVEPEEFAELGSTVSLFRKRKRP